MGRFDDKVVLVTGAGSGIGAATAARFVDEGASVAVLDISDDVLDGIDLVKNNRDGSVLPVACDVSDSGQVKDAVGKVVQWRDRLDIVVNNAGVGSVGKTGDLDDAEWRKAISIDLDGVFYFAREALPHLMKSKGNIVNTASISGLRGDQSMVAYNTAKGGVVNFTRATAVDYGHDGVRVNSVCPGPVRTPIIEDALAQQEISDQYQERIPLGRVGEPEDIAAAITFLASDDAAFITGTNLTVDGGLTAWSAQPDIASGLSG